YLAGTRMKANGHGCGQAPALICKRMLTRPVDVESNYLIQERRPAAPTGAEPVRAVWVATLFSRDLHARDTYPFTGPYAGTNAAVVIRRLRATDLCGFVAQV